MTEMKLDRAISNTSNQLKEGQQKLFANMSSWYEKRKREWNTSSDNGRHPDIAPNIASLSSPGTPPAVSILKVDRHGDDTSNHHPMVSGGSSVDISNEDDSDFVVVPSAHPNHNEQPKQMSTSNAPVDLVESTGNEVQK